MELLTSGVFAREAGLSRKAPRVYEQHDVLLPVAVDAETGYRFYARHQLATARLVARLRSIDMPLARVRAVCSLPPHECASAVAAYRDELESGAAERLRDADLLVIELSGGTTVTTPAITLDAAARTDIGAVRTTNEDVAYGDSRLAVVADGLGGHVRGEEASAAAVEVLVRASGAAPTLDGLDALVAEADAEVSSLAVGEERPMTTLTALMLTGDRLALLHIGDGRVYLLRGTEISRLTQDHSHVQNLVDAGRIGAGELRTHPERNLLVRALGAGPGRTEADIALRAALPGDRYLLCTDGMWAEVPPDELAGALPGGTPVEAVDRLVELALRHGAPDNVGVVVADVIVG